MSKAKTKKTTKKKIVKALKESAGPKESVAPKEISLTEVQMKSLDLFEARGQMQQVVAENLRLKGDAITAEYRNQMAAIKARIRSTNDSLQKIKQEHNQFISDLESGLGIALKDYSIEPDGYLVYNPLPDEPTPEE